DDAGLEATVNFTLSVTDAADAPTGISISQAPPPPPPPPPGGEDETITVTVTVVGDQFYFNGELASDFTLTEGNTYIFQQSPTDGNAGHALAISATDGGAIVDGLVFYIDGGDPRTQATYDYYLVSFYTYFELFEIHYTVPEGGADILYFFSNTSDVTGGTVDVQGAYTPPPPPPPPTDPDAITINENELGVNVGTLLTTDQDANDTHTYTLSGVDADLFEIVEGQLKLKNDISANFESKNTYAVTITSTDSTGLSYSQALEVIINNVNEEPTDIKLSATSFNENVNGIIIGAVTTIDEDVGDTYTYSLSGDNSDLFEIVNGQLK
ncbi:uncharacterized protein METZ01_LOCUS345900, partial [marine metagenome]